MSPHFNLKECFSKEKKKTKNSSILIVVCILPPFVMNNLLWLYSSKPCGRPTKWPIHYTVLAPNIFPEFCSLSYVALICRHLVVGSYFIKPALHSCATWACHLSLVSGDFGFAVCFMLKSDIVHLIFSKLETEVSTLSIHYESL